MPGTRLWCMAAALLAALQLAGSCNAAAEAVGVTRAQTATAVARGLDWIDRHPASIADGGLADILDEGVGFRVLSLQPGDPTARAGFSARFAARMATLGALPEFAQWTAAGQKQLTDYYHLVLAAYLMRESGNPTALQPLIVTQAQWALANSPRCDPSKRLSIALYLTRLDAEPGISLPAALAASRSARIADGHPPALPAGTADPAQRRAAELALYGLVHEIVALTDFGSVPAPPWLDGRRAALAAYLVQAIAWAAAEENIDLLSELALTAAFIEAPLQELLPDILQLLVSAQQADGSWGQSRTVRANAFRHAVFTATTALRGLQNGNDTVPDRHLPPGRPATP
ncbi:MAG: hypothetical protein R3F42_15650 [Pseudomonadota bacterium]